MVDGGFVTPRDATPDVARAIAVLNAKGRDAERVIEEAAAAATTSDDSTDPHPVTSLTGTKHENFMRLAWVNPLNSDLDYIKITKVTDAADDNTETIYVPTPVTHADDLDTVSTSDYTYTVVAVDDSGNESTSVSVEISKETLPAPDEIFNETWTGDALELSWDHVDGFGVSGYRVQIYNNDILRRTEDVTGTKYDYTFAKNSADGLFYEVTVRVYTIDALNIVSIGYVESEVTHVAPGAPTNVVASVCDTGFKISWDLSTDPSIIGYDIYLNGSVIEQRHTTGEYLYKTLLTAGDYQFSVLARNSLGQLSSSNTQPYTVDGPAQPSSITATVIDNNVTLKWTAPLTIELPIACYEIRKGDVFVTAEVVGRKQGDFTVIPEATAGTFKYWVAAVDSAGNIGVPISFTTSVDQPPDYVLNIKWDDDFTGGNSTNVLVQSDGSAIAPYYVGQTWQQKLTLVGATTWQDLLDDGNTCFCEPVPATASFDDEHDYEAVLPSSSVSSNINKTDYNGGPTIVTKLASKLLISDTYVDVIANQMFALNFQYVRDKFEFTSDGHQFAYLDKHILQLDSKLKSDAGMATITTASTGVTVAFNKAFVDVASVILQAHGDGSALLTPILDFVDAPNPTTFIIYLLDSTGTKTTGTVSWVAKGY